MSIKLKELDLVVQLPNIYTDLPQVILPKLEEWAQSMVGAQVQTHMSRVNSPPEEFRASLFSPQLKIHVSLNRLHIQTLINENNQIEGHKKLLAIWQDNKKYIEYLQQITRANSGHFFVLAKIHYPTKVKNSVEEITSLLHDNFLKLAPPAQTANFNLTLGYKEKSNFLNYTFRSYETRQIVLPPNHKPGQPLMLPKDKMPLTETGIELLLDINNLGQSPQIINSQAVSLLQLTSTNIETAPFVFFNQEISKILQLPQPPLPN